MDDPLKKAFDSTLDLTKQLITLSTGTLALTATFLRDILKIQAGQSIPNPYLLYTTWGLMLLSIFCGLLAHGAIIGTLEGYDMVKTGPNANQRLSPFNSNIRIWAVSQSAIFYLGILLLVIYVAVSV